ncbi:hypothetical protein H310_05375 [Aphanomyces invadans]|uniref:Uncharacterized protein n=1 Tax=Aphanomyces invadans TaxID=157072 RepID=A0A024U949_9STRA|nr:hypothetical protein H310_05375 [Aphanomyces invadans]ETW02911.1 hypothetical protein H310_05375 [Aphanomyces invadans]RHY22174.1 hypothetical protein DYB32_009588 [Aphanomyces invadans]|eukprot:XP_008868295.1 hypothetical protein H310_05375 [Aphanomyces invadans]
MKEGCLRCCSGLSAAGVIYLSLMSIMLSKQPEYIRGLHHHDKHDLHSSCAVAAVMYALCLGGCVYALRAHNESKHLRYGVKVVSSSDECDPLKKSSDEDDGTDLKVRGAVSGGVISAIKTQLMKAKVMHSDEMHSLVESDGSSSPRKPKPRKGD